MATPALDKLLEEYAHLKEAEALLEAVYIELGPYLYVTPNNCEAIGAKHANLTYLRGTWAAVRNHFKFDDSE